MAFMNYLKTTCWGEGRDFLVWIYEGERLDSSRGTPLQIIYSQLYLSMLDRISSPSGHTHLLLMQR